MANHKSAIKRARQSQTARLRNMARKTRAKGAVKELQAALSDGKVEEAQETFKKTVATLHKTASKGVIHKKKASRKISRLARAVNRAAARKVS